jgi:hypothetical protein
VEQQAQPAGARANDREWGLGLRVTSLQHRDQGVGHLLSSGWRLGGPLGLGDQVGEQGGAALRPRPDRYLAEAHHHALASEDL